MLHAALIGAVCVAALSGPAQEGNPAKDLFDKMDAKLRGAKSLSFKCRSEQSGEGVGRGFVEGRVTLEGKTKARAQFRGFLNSEARKYELTSDGRQNKWFVSVFGDGGGPTPSSMLSVRFD